MLVPFCYLVNEFVPEPEILDSSSCFELFLYRDERLPLMPDEPRLPMFPLLAYLGGIVFELYEPDVLFWLYLSTSE